MQGLEGFTPVKVACGRLHTVVVTEDGKVLTFGSGKVGQLGHGDSADSKLPKVVEGLAGHHVVDVACGKGTYRLILVVIGTRVASCVVATCGSRGTSLVATQSTR